MSKVIHHSRQFNHCCYGNLGKGKGMTSGCGLWDSVHPAHSYLTIGHNVRDGKLATW